MLLVSNKYIRGFVISYLLFGFQFCTPGPGILSIVCSGCFNIVVIGPRCTLFSTIYCVSSWGSIGAWILYQVPSSLVATLSPWQLSLSMLPCRKIWKDLSGQTNTMAPQTTYWCKSLAVVYGQTWIRKSISVRLSQGTPYHCAALRIWHMSSSCQVISTSQNDTASYAPK